MMPITGPWSASSDCHAMVRNRKLVKNGTITRPSSRFRHFPPRNAMKYAIGYAMRMHRTVAIPANQKERSRIDP